MVRFYLVTEAGQNATSSAQSWGSPPVSVVVTPTYKTAVWVEGLGTSGFTIKVSDPPALEQKLYWQAVW